MQRIGFFQLLKVVYMSSKLIKGVLVAAILVNLGVLLGRFSGFIRELIIANKFGVSQEADLTILLLTFPDLMINILVGGGLSAALIPLMVANKDKSQTIAFQAVFMVGIVFVVMALVLSFLSPYILSILAPGFSGHQKALALHGLSLSMWVLPLFAITGVVTAYLHASNKFAIPSLGTLFFNGVVIVFLVFLLESESFNVEIIVFAILTAGFVRFLSQFAAMKPKLNQFNFERRFIDHEIVKRYFQAMFAGGVFFLFPVVARAFATYSGEGSLAVFSYAMRLIEFPLLISVTFISIVFFPRLSRSFLDDKEEFKRILVICLHLAFIFGGLATSLLISNAYGYVSFVFLGSLDKNTIQMVVELISIGLLAICFQGIVSILTVALQASNNTKLPLVMNTIAFVSFTVWLILYKENTLVSIMYSLVVVYALLASAYLIACRKWLLNKIVSHKFLLFYFVLLVHFVFLVPFLSEFIEFVDSRVGWLLSFLLLGLLSLSTSVAVYPEVISFIKRKFSKNV